MTILWKLTILLTTYGFSFIAHAEFESQIITFKNQNIELKGYLYRPEGKGPYPTILYNHGSAPKMLSKEASDALGPEFAKKGWVFFMPFRRGQGLSENAGPYIMDEVQKEKKAKGKKAAATLLINRLQNEHLSDQVAAMNWLKSNPLVNKMRIAVAGNSFGGILTILGAEKENYCAGIDAAGAAQSWSSSPELQHLLINSAQNIKTPIFFFQAENDFDLTPSKILHETMEKKGLKSVLKIYPSFGKTASEGHAFAYRGKDIWINDVVDYLTTHCE